MVGAVFVGSIAVLQPTKITLIEIQMVIIENLNKSQNLVNPFSSCTGGLDWDSISFLPGTTENPGN
jgi:hypothetical protein